MTGVDFSPVALRKARESAAARGLADRTRWIRGDLTSPRAGAGERPFELLVDYETLDDLRGARRCAMAVTIERLSREGSRFLMWCFYAARKDLPVISFKGPR